MRTCSDLLGVVRIVCHCYFWSYLEKSSFPLGAKSTLLLPLGSLAAETRILLFQMTNKAAFMGWYLPLVPSEL